jgi:hypothetical protein
VDEKEVQRRLLARFNLRAGDETARYVLRRLTGADADAAAAPIPVMGGDARTGVAVRVLVDPDRLSGAADGAGTTSRGG